MRIKVQFRKYIPKIKEVSSSPLFWNKIIAIAISLIAIELYTMIHMAKEMIYETSRFHDAIPVYLMGGDIDVSSGSVEIDGAVDVRGYVDTY